MTPSPASPLPFPSGRNNKARIIDCAITLFNRHGLQSVSIDQICTQLQISKGNLTYHFKRKDDLVRATVDVLKAQLPLTMHRPESVTTALQTAHYLNRIYTTFWAFRFYFNAMEYLLTNNEAMRTEYKAIRGWVIDAIEGAVSFLSARGEFQAPVAPNTFHALAENIWAVLLHWLRQQQVEQPEALQPSAGALQDIAFQQWSLCQLWMEPRFSQALLAATQSLPDEEMI